MNKPELIERIASTQNMTKKDAATAVEAVIKTIADALATNETVKISGFGVFEVKERAARNGRNPATGEEMVIEATNRPVFKPARALKDAVK